MLSVASALISRLAPTETMSRRDMAALGLISVLHLAALMIMAATEVDLIAKTAFLLFWMLLNWGMSIITFYLVLHAYFAQTQWSWALFGLGAGAAGNAVPSAPGAVGTYEGALGGALTLVSHDQSTSLAVALTAHFLNYLTAIILGGYALIRDGQSLSGIYQQLMAFRTKASEQK